MVASLHPDLQRGEPDIASIDIAPAAPGSQIDDGSLFALAPGQVAGLSGLPGSGLTRLGLSLIAPYATTGAVAFLDVRGWVNPQAAWEMGIEPERFVVVRSEDIVSWGRIVATLLDGVRGVYAEVPPGVRDAALRKLVAKARSKRTPLVLRPLNGVLPSGVAHLHLTGKEVQWSGTDAGHGRLTTRRTLLEASGKSARGMERTIEIEDDGTNDMRVVPHVGAQAARRFA
jgi:hypothetical protein